MNFPNVSGVSGTNGQVIPPQLSTIPIPQPFMEQSDWTTTTETVIGTTPSEPQTVGPASPHPLAQTAHAVLSSAAGSSPGASLGSGSPGGRGNLKVEDALTYLDLVKARFTDKNRIYLEFLDVMREFKSQSIDTYAVINRVRDLFHGHNDLILGFNTFLPPGYRMESPIPPGYQTPAPSVTPTPPTSIETVSTTASSVVRVQPASVTSTTAPVTMGLNVQTAPTPPTPSQLNLPRGPPYSLAGLSAAAGDAHGAVSPSIRSGIIGQSLTQALPSVGSRSIQFEPAPLSGTNLNLMAMASTPALSTHPMAPPMHAPPSMGAAGGALSFVGGQQQQPAEFSHAIHYVNKIKGRFQSQPEVYKRFLEILHWYQKEQRNPDPILRNHTEKEVYQEVAKLFKGQEDLLTEFNQFLPDATGFQTTLTDQERAYRESPSVPRRPSGNGSGLGRSGLEGERKEGKSKRSTIASSEGMERSIKKAKTIRDAGLSELGQNSTQHEYALFTKIHKALKHPKTYENFLSILEMFNLNLITEEEVARLTEPFLRRYPDLIRQVREMVGVGMSSGASMGTSGTVSPDLGFHDERRGLVETDRGDSSSSFIMPGRESSMARERSEGRWDIDPSQLRACGMSYRALPKDYALPKCSGRNNNTICKEVLNDSYVSFSSMSSEDSHFVSSKKSPFEEHMYRVEDERYEVDMVVEVNRAAILNLVAVQKKMERMTTEESGKFRLDDCLGGTSPVLMRKAIQRIYGDKAGEMIYGLTRNPGVAVPLVLNRLREKDAEWKKTVRDFHQTWREQDCKYYLRSLDHQGQSFKQKDIPALRGKILIAIVEGIAEGKEKDDEEETLTEEGPLSRSVTQDESTHHILVYPEDAPLKEAADLIIHTVKRMANPTKEDKQAMKWLLRSTIQDLLRQDRFTMSDDEDGLIEEDLQQRGEGAPSSSRTGDVPEEQDYLSNLPQEEDYSLLYGSNTWFVVLRLHHLLVERLSLLRDQALRLTTEAERERVEQGTRVPVADVLRLKRAAEFGPEEYFSRALGYVRDFLDNVDDSASFEDRLRDLFGIHAYPWFTIDRLVHNLARQIYALVVTDDVSRRLLTLYTSARERGGAGGKVTSRLERANDERAYRLEAMNVCGDVNCFRLLVSSGEQLRIGVKLLKRDPVTVQPQTDPGEVEAQTSRIAWTREVRNWSDYIARYQSVSDCPPMRMSAPVLRTRSARRCIQRLASAAAANRMQQLIHNPDTTMAELSSQCHPTGEEEGKLDSEPGPLSDQSGVGPKQIRMGEVRSWKRDTCSLIKMVFDVDLPESELFRDTLSTDRMEVKDSLGSYRITWSPGSYGLFVRKTRPLKLTQEYQSCYKRKLARYRSFHSAWLEEHVDPVKAAEIDAWLVRPPQEPVKEEVVTMATSDVGEEPMETE